MVSVLTVLSNLVAFFHSQDIAKDLHCINFIVFVFLCNEVLPHLKMKLRR